MTLHNVNIDRDLYYTVERQRTNSGKLVRARGGVERPQRPHEGQAQPYPLHLGPDEFYCLGDNSPKSQDSRYWQHVNPWITQQTSAGEPRPGIVPRELMIGRAFYVYFPAPYPWKSNKPGVFPNFGRMRFIH